MTEYTIQCLVTGNQKCLQSDSKISTVGDLRRLAQQQLCPKSESCPSNTTWQGKCWDVDTTFEMNVDVENGSISGEGCNESGCFKVSGTVTARGFDKEVAVTFTNNHGDWPVKLKWSRERRELSGKDERKGTAAVFCNWSVVAFLSDGYFLPDCLVLDAFSKESSPIQFVRHHSLGSSNSKQAANSHFEWFQNKLLMSCDTCLCRALSDTNFTVDLASRAADGLLAGHQISETWFFEDQISTGRLAVQFTERLNWQLSASGGIIRLQIQGRLEPMLEWLAKEEFVNSLTGMSEQTMACIFLCSATRLQRPQRIEGTLTSKHLGQLAQAAGKVKCGGY